MSGMVDPRNTCVAIDQKIVVCPYVVIKGPIQRPHLHLKKSLEHPCHEGRRGYKGVSLRTSSLPPTQFAPPSASQHVESKSRHPNPHCLQAQSYQAQSSGLPSRSRSASISEREIRVHLPFDFCCPNHGKHSSSKGSHPRLPTASRSRLRPSFR